MSPRTRKKITIQTDADGKPTADTIRRAIQDLGIDKPVMKTRVVGGRIELTLYGGDVVFWPPKAKRTRS